MVISIIMSAFFVLGVALLVVEKRNDIRISQEKKIFSGKVFLEQVLETSFEDIAVMANSQIFITLMAGQDLKGDMDHLFQSLLTDVFNAKPHYNQLRFLDNEGMEKYRVERIGGITHQVRNQNLQDKSGRYYFKEALKLKKGEYYVSPFDLNVENGKIEIPVRPMIRICAGVFDKTGKKSGVLVVNFDGSDVYRKFKHRINNYPGDAYLVNEDGFFLVAPDASLEWGFMFDDNSEKQLARVFEDDHEVIEKTNDGQFTVENGLYSIASVNPLSNIRRYVRNNIYPLDYHWKLISFLPKKEFAVFTLVPFYTLLFLFIFLIGMSFLLAWFYTNMWFKEYCAQMQLIASERKLKDINETRHRFLSIISHDLKNSSVGISAFLSFLIENFDMFSDEEKLSNLNDLNQATTQHNKLLVEILDWARLQQGTVKFEPHRVDVQALFQEQVENVQLMLKNKGLQVKLQVQQDLEVFGDLEMLKTVFRNLLNNAIKFSNPDEEIILRGKSKAEFVELSVQDHGVGIAEEDIEKLFKVDSKFFRKGTQQEEGSGFGLKLVAGLVAKNNGVIHVESEVGKGSSFIVSLPSGK